MTRNRYITACAILAAAIALLFALLATWQHASQVAAQHAASAVRTNGLVAAFEQQRQADLARRAELVADDAAFVNYVEVAMGGALPGMQPDTTSLVDLLGERQRRLGFALTAVLDHGGRVVASTSPLLPNGSHETSEAFVHARDAGARASGLTSRGGDVFDIVVVPLASVGLSDAFVLVANPIGPAFAHDAAAATGADVVVIASPGGRVVTTSMATTDASDIARSLAAGGSRRDLLRRPLLGSDTATLVVRTPPAAGAATWWIPWLLACLFVLGTLVALARYAWRRLLLPIDIVAERLERACAGDTYLQIADSDAGALSRLSDPFNRLMLALRT